MYLTVTILFPENLLTQEFRKTVQLICK